MTQRRAIVAPVLSEVGGVLDCAHRPREPCAHRRDGKLEAVRERLVRGRAPEVLAQLLPGLAENASRIWTSVTNLPNMSILI